MNASARNDNWTQNKDRLVIIETRIGHELNLVSHRLTWLVTSEAFLTAAWVTTLKNFNCPADSGAVHLLFMLIPTVAIAIAIAAGAATMAAKRVLATLLRARHPLDDALGLEHMGFTRRDPWTIWAGRLPPWLLPPVFVGAWLAIILTTQVGRMKPESAAACGAFVAATLAGGAGYFVWRRRD